MSYNNIFPKKVNCVSIQDTQNQSGEVAEWLKAPLSKSGKGETPSRVRIPPSPHLIMKQTTQKDVSNKKLSRIFHTLSKKLTNIDCALLGSLNLQFQGVKTNPQDVDFLTNDKGTHVVSEIFNSPITREHGYLETQFYIEDIEVHFTSNTPNNIRSDNFMKETVIIEKFGIPIRCMSLESELEAYQKMNREKDQEKIVLLEAKLS